MNVTIHSDLEKTEDHGHPWHGMFSMIVIKFDQAKCCHRWPGNMLSQVEKVQLKGIGFLL